MLELVLQLERGTSWPCFGFNVPATQVDQKEISVHQQQQTWQVDAAKTVELIYVDKPSEETVVDSEGNIVRDQTLEICAAWYQGIKLNLHIVSAMSAFYPVYRKDFVEYCKQHSISIDPGPLHQTKFWHAGAWRMNLVDNFWLRYKQARLSKEQHNDYVGHNVESIQKNLQRLKVLL